MNAWPARVARRGPVVDTGSAVADPSTPRTLGTLLRNLLRSLPPRKLATVLAEEYLGMLLRPLPGPEGFGLRWLLYKLLFKRLDGYCYVYPGVRLSHVYGISAGRGLAVSQGAFIYGRGGITFGDDVMIGPNAVIVSSQHRFDDPRLPMVYQGHQEAPVTIGSDVWIGANAVVVPGVTIADGTVVGAGAVVTRDTEPYTIVGGIPAALIGHRPRLPAPPLPVPDAS